MSGGEEWRRLLSGAGHAEMGGVSKEGRETPGGGHPTAWISMPVPADANYTPEPLPSVKVVALTSVWEG